MSGVRPGDVVAGKFRVERVLGEGGMGYVVSARHLQLGQVVALKFMRDEVFTPDYRTRFMREARNTVRLKSKHVSRVLDVGALDGGAPYIVMEYLEGTDLSALLHSRGPFPVHEACEFVLQACEALAEAHGYGIVHRDLKPANLFLTRGPGGEPIVKVLDFGVSKVIELAMEQTSTTGDGRVPPTAFDIESVVTKATDLLGSPSYMAPEQIVSARDADSRSDIWSLGVILFRLISGKAPFAAQALGELIQQIVHGETPNLRDFRPDLPPGLEHVVARCLVRDREQRLQEVVELARLLAPYAGPVATPSLERIAVLGPALLTHATHHGPRPSGASFGSGSSPMGWTSPPQSAPNMGMVPSSPRPSFPPGMMGAHGAGGGGAPMSMPPGSFPPASLPPPSHPHGMPYSSPQPSAPGFHGYPPPHGVLPVPPEALDPRRDLSTLSATVLGVLFAAIVLLAVVAVVKFIPAAGRSQGTTAPALSTAPAPVATPAPLPAIPLPQRGAVLTTTPPELLPSEPGTAAPPPVPAPPTTVLTPVTAWHTTTSSNVPTATSAPIRTATPKPKPKPAGGGAAGDDIPATRD